MTSGRVTSDLKETLEIIEDEFLYLPLFISKERKCHKYIFRVHTFRYFHTQNFHLGSMLFHFTNEETDSGAWMLSINWVSYKQREAVSHSTGASDVQDQILCPLRACFLEGPLSLCCNITWWRGQESLFGLPFIRTLVSFRRALLS